MMSSDKLNQHRQTQYTEEHKLNQEQFQHKFYMQKKIHREINIEMKRTKVKG